MRQVTTGLKTFLDTWNPIVDVATADLYTFILITDEVFRFSNAQIDIHAPAPGTESPLFHYIIGPIIDRSKTKIEIGTKVGELTLTMFPAETDLIGTMTWFQACIAGLLDGAIVKLDRVFLSPPDTVVGTLPWFRGRVGEIDIGSRTKIIIKVRSLMDLLTVQMPNRFIQAQCAFVFGGPLCHFPRETMSSDVTALSGSSQGTIITSLLPADFPLTPTQPPPPPTPSGPPRSANPSPSTLYDQGTIISTSGLNDSFRRTIGRMVSGQIYFLQPWFFPVTPGDTFHLLPGCDHTPTTCNDTFNNFDHYGGFLDVPPPEDAV
jgi:hypothetical protein